MIAVAVLGFVNGEIKHYYYGTDVYGNMCSSDNSNRKYVSADKRLDNSNKPYVYFPDTTNLTISYCVEKCPDIDDVNNVLFSFHFFFFFLFSFFFFLFPFSSSFYFIFFFLFSFLLFLIYSLFLVKQILCYIKKLFVQKMIILFAK